MRIVFILIAVLAAIGTLQIGSASAEPLSHPLPGAIFTTLPDGSVVNGNIYNNKCDVALNGGPSHPQVHHLPDGKYDVAVTDPSGKVRLGVGEGTVTINNGEGTFDPTSLCDLVSPSPYETTPNPGGEYKAWLCTAGSLFSNNDCKTDNFKVRPSVPPTPSPTPTPPPGVAPSPTPALVIGPPWSATPVPTPTPVIVTPAEATPVPSPSPTPTPEQPKGFPDTGGEPSESSDVFGSALLWVPGGLSLLVGGGFLIWRFRRGIL